ncbi:MAG: peptide-methionine (S)-S-oxide reductase [Flavobacteriaceae bacterium]
MEKIGLGGGCHWCTEAIFQSLIGVHKVEQGYISSTGIYDTFSEAVIVHYHETLIDLKTLIEIHLRTHKSASNHSMREKYRSAVYTFSEKQHQLSKEWITYYQEEFSHQLITLAIPFYQFKASRESIQNYYYNNPKKPFCQRFIDPKLQVLLKRFSNHVQKEKIKFGTLDAMA